MKSKSKKSKSKRRAVPATLKKSEQPRLLYSRGEVVDMLGCSQSTLIRMENAGRLRPVKVTGLVLGKTFYSSFPHHGSSHPRH